MVWDVAAGADSGEDSEPDRQRRRVENMLYAFAITIKMITGREFPICVQPYTSALELKEFIFASQGIPVIQQRLIFCGRELGHDTTMGQAGVSGGNTLELLLSVRGGGGRRFDNPEVSVDEMSGQMADDPQPHPHARAAATPRRPDS